MNFSLMAVTVLREKGHYKGAQVLLKGNTALEAAAKYLVESEPGIVNRVRSIARMSVAVVQCYLREKGFNPGKIDGYAGPMTEYAVQEWQGKIDYFLDKPERPQIYPYQKDVPEFYGKMNSHQVKVHCPYPLYLAWNNEVDLQEFSCHEKVADSLTKAMDLIFKEYGEIKIKNFGLDQWGGCLNPRLMRGSKTQWSMHSWGIAVDWFPQKNQWKWGRDLAHFAKPEYKDFLDIWESLGWVSLGRERNYDWMHVQAARINP